MTGHHSPAGSMITEYFRSHMSGILRDHGNGGRRCGVGERQHDGDSVGADVPVGFGDGGPGRADRVLASAMTEIWV